MKIKNSVLIMLLALSLTIPMFATKSFAEPVTNPATHSNIIEWYGTTEGATNYATLSWNPEYLKLTVAQGVPVMTHCTIIVQGKDVFGKDIEAKVILDGTHAHPVTQEEEFIFCDMHTDPPKPVAFAYITAILQQNATDGNKFLISTEPVEMYLDQRPAYYQYLGEYHAGSWSPGMYTKNGWSTQKYWVAYGSGTTPKLQDVPVEPTNPDPLMIVLNWLDANHDLYPDWGQTGQPNELGTAASPTTTVTIEGLDENGNKVITDVTVPAGASRVEHIAGCTYSTICKVKGGNQIDSYYIFTEPYPQRPLFYYKVLVDHLTIHPASYDILAYPDAILDDAVGAPIYPGVTTVTVALRDIDGNLVHWGGGDWTNWTPQQPFPDNPIVINFYSSGGKIQPSDDVFIHTTSVSAMANLTADTNPRTINVTCDANVPAVWAGSSTPSASHIFFHDELNLFVWTELTFDGVNSVNNYVWGRDWPIHTMQWGYMDASGAHFTLDVPPKPVLPPELGGPAANGIKLDGPIYEVTIPLYIGCNLISSPVHPILGTYYYTGYPNPIPGTGTLPTITIDNNGIPMDLLFNYTSARDCIEAIWWYCDGTWHVYVPGVTSDPTAYFRDGVGYWVKAEKSCVIEISGILMENGPFTPPTYELQGNSWNLIGVTSITGIPTSEYLNSVSGSLALMAAGPVWEYNNPLMTNIPAILAGWHRNPSDLWPTQAFWVYNKVPSPQYIAP